MKKIYGSIIVLLLTCIVPLSAMDDGSDLHHDGREPLKFVIDAEESIVRDAEGADFIKKFNLSLKQADLLYETLAETLLTQVKEVEADVEPQTFLGNIQQAIAEYSTLYKICQKHSITYRNKLLEESAQIQKKRKQLSTYSDLLREIFHIIYDPQPLSDDEQGGEKYWGVLANMGALQQEKFPELTFDFFYVDNFYLDDSKEEVESVGSSCKSLKIKEVLPSKVCQELNKAFHPHLKLAQKLPEIQKDIRDRSELTDRISAKEERYLRPNQLALLGNIKKAAEMTTKDICIVLGQQIEALMREVHDIIIELAPVYYMACAIEAFQNEVVQHQLAKDKDPKALQQEWSQESILWLRQEASLPIERFITKQEAPHQKPIQFQIIDDEKAQRKEVKDAPGYHLMETLASSERELGNEYTALTKRLEEEAKEENLRLMEASHGKTYKGIYESRLLENIVTLREEEALLQRCCQIRTQEILHILYKGEKWGDKGCFWAIPNVRELTSYFSNLLKLSYAAADISTFYTGIHTENMSHQIVEDLNHFFETQPLMDQLEEIQRHIFERSEIIYLIATNKPLDTEQLLILSSTGKAQIEKEKEKEIAIYALNQQVTQFFKDINSILRKLAPRYWMAQAIGQFQKEVDLHQSGEAKRILAASRPPEEKPSQGWFQKAGKGLQSWISSSIAQNFLSKPSKEDSSSTIDLKEIDDNDWGEWEFVEKDKKEEEQKD